MRTCTHTRTRNPFTALSPGPTGEPVPEEIFFWTFMVQGKTMGARDSGQNVAILAVVLLLHSYTHCQHMQKNIFKKLETTSIAEPLQNRQHTQNP